MNAIAIPHPTKCRGITGKFWRKYGPPLFHSIWSEAAGFTLSESEYTLLVSRSKALWLICNLMFDGIACVLVQLLTGCTRQT